MKKITTDQILHWHGEGDNESLANLIAEILNGEYSIETARKDILAYSEDDGDEE